MGPFAPRLDEEEDLAALPAKEDEARFAAARRKLYEGLRASVDELLQEIDPENAGARMAAIGRLSTSGSKMLMGLGSGTTARTSRNLIGDRETAGVASMRELITAQAEANRPPIEVRLRHLTEAHLNAVNGGLLEAAAALRTEIESLSKQLGAPPPDHAEVISAIAGRIADEHEIAAESK